MKILHLVSVAVLSSIVGTAGAVEPLVGPYTIVQIANGWTGEQLAIIVSGGASPCPLGPNEYAISSTHPAYKELVSMAMLAFAADIRVLIRLDGTCVANQRGSILELRPVK
jgi:hypothetical protein